MIKLYIVCSIIFCKQKKIQTGGDRDLLISITFEESNRRVGVRGQEDESTWSEIIIKPMCININLIDCFCIRLLSFLFRSGLCC